MADDAPALDALIQPGPAPVLGIGETAAVLAEALAEGDLLFAAADEPGAAGVAYALVGGAERGRAALSWK